MTTREARPWSKEAKGGPFDAIVIGSGIGGMTAAALLAKTGLKVCVLEQHYVPGGFTHTFTRGPYRWDVGVHAVGEVTAKNIPGRLLRLLTDGKLEWASLGPVYDTFKFPDGLQLEFPDNPIQFRENLLRAFPREGEAIDRYLKLVKTVASGMGGYYLSRILPRRISGPAQAVLGAKVAPYLKATTREVIESLTTDPRLRTVFAAQWGYYGSTPSHSAFAMQALVVQHFFWGGYYPVGGAGRIAETLLATVAAVGGWTRIMADVEQVLIEGGRAVGVRLKSGEEIRAPKVISAAGVLSTVHNLLPGEYQKQDWVQGLGKLRSASAHVCLYLGFKGDIRTAGAGSANQWFYETYDTEEDAWRVTPTGELPAAPVLYVSFPSIKDPSHTPADRHTGEVVTFAPWEVFEPWRDLRWKRRGADYEAFKARMKDRLLQQLFEKLPGLKPMLDFAELSTPVTTEHFVRPTAGSIYGIEPTPARFASTSLKPRSPIRGLYFAGSDVSAVGVVGAMMGGALAAVAAHPWAATRLLTSLSSPR